MSVWEFGSTRQGYKKSAGQEVFHSSDGQLCFGSRACTNYPNTYQFQGQNPGDTSKHDPEGLKWFIRERERPP